MLSTGPSPRPGSSAWMPPRSRGSSNPGSKTRRNAAKEREDERASQNDRLEQVVRPAPCLQQFKHQAYRGKGLRALGLERGREDHSDPDPAGRYSRRQRGDPLQGQRRVISIRRLQRRSRLHPRGPLFFRRDEGRRAPGFQRRVLSPLGRPAGGGSPQAIFTAQKTENQKHLPGDEAPAL